MKKSTILNLLLILFVISFFVTPLGYESKILLQRIFASGVDIIPANEAKQYNFNWKLKERNNEEFYFASKGSKPAFVYYFASWRAISIADLYAVEKLYDSYKDKVDFYIITNELPAPVEEMMQKRNFHFKVTYLIMQEKNIPFNPEEIPSGYILDKNGYLRAEKQGIARWNSDKVHELIDSLIMQ